MLDAPFLLDWHNASAVFNDPVRAHIGLVLLTHQLGYFDILPLYFVLMLVAPLVALAHRHARPILLPVSLAIYVYALAFGVNFPTWPVEGVWFFNPLAWQFIYVLGFLLAGDDGLGALARRFHKMLRWLALPIVVLGMIVARTNFSPDPIAVPDPKLFFLFDKSFLSPARLIHSLALTALFAGSFKTISIWLPRISKFLNLLGRNSLNVFCAASLLSLIGQITRFEYGGLVATDAVIIITGVLVMGMVAWVSEWRARLRMDLAPAIGIALAFELVLIFAPRAQEAARPAAPPPLSSACDVPAADIAAPVPLPNFAAALKERKSARILAIGSSSTAGVGATSTGKTYPSQLEAILETALKGVDIQIVNRGVSGEVAEIAAERIPSEVAINKPDLVLWQLGTNDALAPHLSRGIRSHGPLDHSLAEGKQDRHRSRRDAIHAAPRPRRELFGDSRQFAARRVGGERALCPPL